MVDRTIIHVGPAKTGTSALQKWLLENREWLHRQGVFYPKHPISDIGISSGNYGDILYTGADGQRQVDSDACRQIERRAAQGGCHTLLLSSEHFPPVVHELAAAFPRARFVYYFRNPQHAMESGYNQWVKRHGETRRLCDYHETFSAEFTMRCRELRRVVTEIGPESFLFRFYGPGLFEGGSIVSDFLAAIGVPNPGVESPPTVNSRYSLEALEFRRLANHFPKSRKADARLDNLLQSYDDSTRGYSLIDDQRSRQATKTLVAELAALNKALVIPGFDRFIETVVHEPPGDYRPQHITPEGIEKISRYIRQRDRRTWQALRKAVSRRPRAVVEDNPAFVRRVGGWRARLRLLASGLHP